MIEFNFNEMLFAFISVVWNVFLLIFRLINKIPLPIRVGFVWSIIAIFSVLSFFTWKFILAEKDRLF